MSLTTYHPEAYTDWSQPNHQAAMNRAIEWVRKNWLGKDWPLHINGQDLTTGTWITRHNPGKTDELIGRVASAKREHADQAMDAALSAFESWSRTDAAARARYLLRTMDAQAQT